MIDLTTTYMGLRLANPVIVGSSGLTQSLDGVRRCAEAGAGAIVLKSIFEEQIEVEAAEMTRGAQTVGWRGEAEEYVARYGREGAAAHTLELIREAKRAVPVPIIASIHCVSSEGWADFAARAARAGADAVELNVYVLPADPRIDPRDNEAVYFEAARAVTRAVSIPVALKVGPYFSGLARTLVELSRTGIRGLVLFNRVFPVDFDIESVQIVPGVIHSASAESLLPMRWISILSGRVACDLAASTGVHDGATVVKQILAGAAAVQVCSVLYEREIPYLATIVGDLRAWMERRRITSIDAFRGALAQKNVANPAAYERVQFMKSSGIE